MLVNSNSILTWALIEQINNFPPAALTDLRADTKAPNPELSINVTSCKSINTTLAPLETISSISFLTCVAFVPSKRPEG